MFTVYSLTPKSKYLRVNRRKTVSTGSHQKTNKQTNHPAPNTYTHSAYGPVV